MVSVFSILGTTLLTTAGAFVALWLLSLALRDASIVDIAWGAGFVQIAWVAAVLSDGAAARRVLVTALVTLWGLRLASHLYRRNWGHGEDFRYQRMRAHHGGRFWLVSLYTVFGLQAGLMWVVSIPVQLAVAAHEPTGLTLLDALGTLIFALGLTFEAVGDRQLGRFRADPANKGRVLDTGLWAWTRHPNYFGDAVVWWGLFTIALATPWGILGVIGPALMNFFLLRVSGVALLEKSLARTKPQYRDYVARTSAFVPWPPKRTRV
jgi:steroid 5-alpha reductase family enzyme